MRSVLSAIIFLLKEPNLKLEINKLKQLAKKYIKYPTVSIIPSLLSDIAIQVPVWILASAYSQKITGAYALSMKTASAPIHIISLSVTTIALQKVTNLHQNFPHLIEKQINKFFIFLTLSSTPIFFTILIFGEDLTIVSLDKNGQKREKLFQQYPSYPVSS